MPAAASQEPGSHLHALPCLLGLPPTLSPPWHPVVSACSRVSTHRRYKCSWSRDSGRATVVGGEKCGQRRALGRGQGDPWAWESCGCLRGAFQLGVHQAWQKGRERLNTQGSVRTKPQSPRGCRGRARVGKVGFLGRWVAASLGDSTPGLACCLQAAPRLEPRQARGPFCHQLF